MTIEIPEIVNKYLSEVATKHSNGPVIIKLKSESSLMKAVGTIFSALKINKVFMTRYYTTIGNTIYIPEAALTENPLTFLSVIIHESIHIKDSNRWKILYNFSYLFPQVLALLSVLSVLALFIGKLWLLWLLALLCLAPFPAYFRYHWEKRAYRTLFLFYKHVYKLDSEDSKLQIRNWIIEQFVTSAYYFTWPFKSYIEKEFSDMSFEHEPEYKEISEFLIKNKVSG